MTSMALCLDAVDLMWQANLILYYFITTVGAHSVLLLAVPVIWTYTLVMTRVASTLISIPCIALFLFSLWL